MADRREFLKQSGALALGGLLASNFKAFGSIIPPAKQALGVQLFTLFNVMDEDVPGSLKKIAGIGYKEIESAFSKLGGFYGLKPKEFAALIKDNGMGWKSHHVIGTPFKMPKDFKPPVGADGKPLTIPPMRNLKDNKQELIDEVAEGGVPYMVCAAINIENGEEIKKSTEILNQTGELCKKAGITFAYHNHEGEFKNIDGIVPYDMFLSQVSPDLLKMELDLCWATKAGVDPVELFKKNPGRFHLWHVKDIDKEMKNLQPVGSGVIDFKRIFDNAKTSGMVHCFVEHDMPADPYASLTTSYANLTKMLG